MQAFLHGIFLGLGLILPLGMQNIFIFNQGASHAKFINAFPSIITAIICDSFFISLTVLGASQAAVLLLEHVMIKNMMIFLGSLFLIYLGFLSWNSKSHYKQSESLSARQQILFTLSVSILNPHAIIDSVAVIAANALSYSHSERLMFGAGCIFVSWLWFPSLAYIGKKIRDMDNTAQYILLINKISAIIVWIISLSLLFNLMKQVI